MPRKIVVPDPDETAEQLNKRVNSPEAKPSADKTQGRKTVKFEGTVEAAPQEHALQGQLLLAPLGRHYAALYESEQPRLGCKTRTYKALFTWWYYYFLALLIAWIGTNYVLLFIQFDKTFSETSFDFTGLDSVYNEDVVVAFNDATNYVFDGNADTQSATNQSAAVSGAPENQTNQTTALFRGSVFECETGLDEDECLYYFQLTFYIQIADWFFTAVYLCDLLLRLYCLDFRSATASKSLDDRLGHVLDRRHEPFPAMPL
jgi:hypothetical protein